MTVENTITPTGGSAVVTVRECHGAAGDPEAACTGGTPVNLTEPVTTVNQCNDSMGGGGGTLRCSVQITNTFVVDPSPTAVTVNQCVGSGEGGIAGENFNCNPFPAITLSATITQCNGSANGLTLVELNCEATGTQSSAFAVTVNQCNDSANGGGALVICSANIDNVLGAPAATATPLPSVTPSVAPPAASPSSDATPAASDSQMPTARLVVTPPPTDASPVTAAGKGGSGTWPVLAVLMLVALAALAGTAGRTRVRPTAR